MKNDSLAMNTVPNYAQDRKTILVIDDEESIRKVLNTHLTKEGYRILQSSGGEVVFNTIRSSGAFDLVLCDIKMPDVDGLRILDFIRQNFDTVPVIMLTGLTDIAVAVEVMKKGAFDYLMKPLKKEDLLSVVGKAVAHRNLLVRNKELELENREYQLFLEQKVRERTKELNAKAAELQKAYALLKSMNIQFVNVLAETIEAKDRYTSGHCNRMRFLCVELGRLAGLSADELELLEYASLLHDLGKVGIKEAVLNKPGPLTEEECRHIKEHSEIGERILHGIPMMEQAARIIGSHHENFNGTGYPKGLAGKDIPMLSRIISVADLYDAMSSDRAYRKGLPLDVVLAEMKRVAGAQLDPDIVNLFIDNKVYLFIKN